MKAVWTCVLALALILMGLGVGESSAASAKRLPTFDMKDLQEREHNLSDAEFKDRPLVIAAFGTWQQRSIEQARELQKFHEAHPDVKIIAFIVETLPVARDFVAHEGLTFDCYKTDGTAPIGNSFNRLFETKKGQTLTLNRAPFVILADKTRNVEFASLGVTTASTLADELAKIGE